MVYKLDGGTVIDQDGKLQIENLHATAVNPSRNAYLGIGGRATNGYTAGGVLPPSTDISAIEKFPFSVDENSTTNADLIQARFYTAGVSSLTHGYTAGGRRGSPFFAYETIDKFPFSSNNDAALVGNTTMDGFGAYGSHTLDNGYISSMYYPPSNSTTIQKFPFASDTNSVNVGNTTSARRFVHAHSSGTHGYTAGGYGPGSNLNIIDKFPFASDTDTSSDVGDLTSARYGGGASSSTTHGYVAAGTTTTSSPGITNIIDKFAFASDGNATDVGDTTITNYVTAGNTSSTHGYNFGGYNGPTTRDVIEKYSHTSDGNGSDVGDLTTARYGLAGNQQG